MNAIIIIIIKNDEFNNLFVSFGEHLNKSIKIPTIRMFIFNLFAFILLITIAFISNIKAESVDDNELDASTSLQSKKFNHLLKLMIDSAVKNRIDELREQARELAANKNNEQGQDEAVLETLIKKYRQLKSRQERKNYGEQFLIISFYI